MAVCNLFNIFNSKTGNFLLFSQYVESITKYLNNGDYRVIPSQYIALDIDYSKIDTNFVFGQKSTLIDDLLNNGLYKFFQNYFENGCAYGRSKYGDDWTPEMSKNLFWNSLWKANMLSSKKIDDISVINEVMHYGSINMHTYNSHKGMGYGEIYCYIPSSAEKVYCQVNKPSDETEFDITNASTHLEGRPEERNYHSKTYYYNKDYIMSFDDNDLIDTKGENLDSFNVNTIVICYSVFKKNNDSWEIEHENIPMGIYFAGMFKDLKLTNTITKHVTTNYGTGTSYGLRICTRFLAQKNGTYISNIETASDGNYTNYCQLMTQMSENISTMLDVVKSAQVSMQNYKELLSIFKNNRTNVPYIKSINGKDYWFVNGKYVSKTDGLNGCCNELSPDYVHDILNDNISTECDCKELTEDELNEILNK